MVDFLWGVAFFALYIWLLFDNEAEINKADASRGPFLNFHPVEHGKLRRWTNEEREAIVAEGRARRDAALKSKKAAT